MNGINTFNITSDTSSNPEINLEQTQNWTHIYNTHVLKESDLWAKSQASKDPKWLRKKLLKVLVSVPFADQNGQQQSLLADPNVGRDYFLEQVHMKDGRVGVVNVLEMENAFLKVDNVKRVEKNWAIREELEKVVEVERSGQHSVNGETFYQFSKAKRGLLLLTQIFCISRSGNIHYSHLYLLRLNN